MKKLFDKKEINKKDWTIIHPDFAKKQYSWSDKTYQQIWEQANLTSQQAQHLINLGLEPTDYNYAEYLIINQNLTPQQINQDNEPELRKEYQKLTLHDYLHWKYPTLQAKQKLKVINTYEINKKEKGSYNKFLQGHSLNLNEFINLEKVFIDGNYLTSPLTDLKINDCQKLVLLECSHNQLTNLDLRNNWQLKILRVHDNNLHQDLSFLRNCVNLKSLVLCNNPFTGSLEHLKGLSKLVECLNIDDTDIDSGLEYLPESIEKFYCSADKRKDAKCQAIYNLFANDQGKVETYGGSIKNFPQRLQVWKKANPELVIKAQKEIIEEKSGKITELEEELQIERETNQESAELMDNFYRQNPPREDLALKNILSEISDDYLEISRENQQLKEENERLKNQLELANKLVELQIQDAKAQILHNPPKTN